MSKIASSPRKGRLGILSGLVSTVIITGALSAGATPGTSETFVLQRDSALNPIGWAASGTFTDSGSWTDPFAVAGGLPSPTVFEIESKTVESSSQGTFQIEFQGHFNAVTNPHFGGTWTISQGTGAYATLRGHGTWSLAIDQVTGTRTFTCPGLVHFD